jgi:hypothetical protein
MYEKANASVASRQDKTQTRHQFKFVVPGIIQQYRALSLFVSLSLSFVCVWLGSGQGTSPSWQYSVSCSSSNDAKGETKRRLREAGGTGCRAVGWNGLNWTDESYSSVQAIILEDNARVDYCMSPCWWCSVVVVIFWCFSGAFYLFGWYGMAAS